MEDSSQFVPVIPDIKDHSMVPPLAPASGPPPPPTPTTTTSWWDWDTWPLPMKLAMGALLVSLICLVIYAAYIWFTKKRDAEKKEAAEKAGGGAGDSGKEGAPKQDMAAIMQTQALLKKRREEELRRAHAKQGQPMVILTTEVEPEEEEGGPPRVEILDDSDGGDAAPPTPKKRLVPSPTAPERVKLPDANTPLPGATPVATPPPQKQAPAISQSRPNEFSVGRRNVILKQPLADESESENESGESHDSGVLVMPSDDKDEIDDFLS